MLLTAIEDAERLWRQGRPADAFAAYRAALHHTLTSGDPLSSADVVALERFADLAALLGEHDAAEHALDAMADLCAAAGNVYAEDYAVLKRTLVLHQGERLQHALEALYRRRRSATSIRSRSISRRCPAGKRPCAGPAPTPPIAR